MPSPTDMLNVLVGILYLIAIITVLVVAHEWGHFIVARLFGMRVDDFSIFFGRVLWRVGKRGDTVYNIRTVPVGGFVRIAGMEADDISGGRPVLEALRHGPDGSSESMEEILRRLDADTMSGLEVANVSAAVQDVVRGSIGSDGRLTESGAGDLRAALLSPRLNADETKLVQLVLNADDRAGDPHLYSRKPIYQRALVIFAGPFMSIFFAYLVFCSLGMTVGLPSDQHTNRLRDVQAGYPAHRAGLRIGDRIVQVDDAPIRDGMALVNAIHARADKPTLIHYERNGQRYVAWVTPRRDVITEGKASKQVGRIGVTPDVILKREGVVESVRDGTLMTYSYLRQIVQVLIVERRVRENLGGPIAMGKITTDAQRLGFAHVLVVAGSLSLSLGIMNLLPIPILDGGHLLLLAIERARRRKLTAREVYRAQIIGLGILAALIVFVMVNDIQHVFGGP